MTFFSHATATKNKYLAPGTGFLRFLSRNSDLLADLPRWVVVNDRYSKSIALDIPALIGTDPDRKLQPLGFASGKIAFDKFTGAAQWAAIGLLWF